MTSKQIIYADNAATTKLAPEALEAMMPFLTEEYGNPSSLYSFSKSVKKALADARAVIAECIGASPNEIFFTSGGTESDNWAIKGFAPYGKVLASSIEHHAVYNSLTYCNNFTHGPGEILPVDRQGIVSFKSLQSALANRVALVSVMLANNEIGTIEPIKELAALTHHQGAAFHTDAVQAVGHIPVNVRELGVDLLSASAHKFHGPKGIGFLYCKGKTPLESFINGGLQEYGLRAGTENVAAIVGMATALRLSCERMQEVTARLEKIAEGFQKTIKENIPDAEFNGDPTCHLPGHISLSIPGISGESLMHILDLKGIAVSTGAACDSQKTQVSHVLKAIALPKALAKGTLRITFGAYNTEGQAHCIADSIVKYYKSEKCSLNDGHLQAKWGKGSGKSEKSFMGGESF